MVKDEARKIIFMIVLYLQSHQIAISFLTNEIRGFLTEANPGVMTACFGIWDLFYGVVERSDNLCCVSSARGSKSVRSRAEVNIT